MSAFLAILAVTMDPIAIAHRLDAHPTQQSAGQLFGVSELHADAPAANSTLDNTATVDTARTGATRGKPRVSKTRCAIVGCETQCNIKGTRDAQGGLVYRTPASPEYARANAERMFCSRADAKEAGYLEEQQG
ncbi:hypothetical protein [Erythrobacter dokdonensis]|uniref:Metallo-beta-lactamase super n=1 Tax=Erythrobacter dokdonensis DSW-74 TaxID=1300349 RepID=A0A1A7BKW5_9SPHN|nr:hypothetical protein [Erythrobacter dokdonensis]OBV12127.1 Metallo-beta-lactamase super [Erythrobacter dokdonensis DSW-74]